MENGKAFHRIFDAGFIEGEGFQIFGFGEADKGPEYAVGDAGQPLPEPGSHGVHGGADAGMGGDAVKVQQLVGGYADHELHGRGQLFRSLHKLAQKPRNPDFRPQIPVNEFRRQSGFLTRKKATCQFRVQQGLYGGADARAFQNPEGRFTRRKGRFVVLFFLFHAGLGDKV